MNLKVGIAQYAPVVLDLNRSVDKACATIQEAKRTHVQLLAFPETWIPVYPVWADMGTFSQWGNERAKKLYARLFNNSLEFGSAAFKRIAAACRKTGMHVVLGVNERAGRSLYNTLLFFGDKGELLGHHRKLVPTFGERLVWGQGDGQGLGVHKTRLGNVGGLVCWEHWMPPARQVCMNRMKRFTSPPGRMEKSITRSRVGITPLKGDASCLQPQCILKRK